jgi:hypothetical protein
MTENLINEDIKNVLNGVERVFLNQFRIFGPPLV